MHEQLGSMTPYIVRYPNHQEVPIVLSVPHCGTTFPDELNDQFKPALRMSPDDTDWFVHKLYNFCFEMGITMIHAHYSRWVIDLNRDPQSKPLYTDGRIITALCPTTTFFGDPIYVDERKEVDQAEVARRVENYYIPYHQQVERLLSDKKARFGRALLWDCHSIRQYVPTINPDRFPDLILGDADETSASKEIISTAYASLKNNDYSVSHNHPFKGGYITRSFGRPGEGVHALQLEMSKVMYMEDNELDYSNARAEKMRGLLQKTLSALVSTLSK